MKNFVQPVNVEALRIALEALVGPEVTETILRTYKAVDQAMFSGYQLGHNDGVESLDERVDAAFDEGFDAGYETAEVDYELDGSDDSAEDDAAEGNLFDHAYDEGYVSGVSDARLRPAVADANVQEIINEQAGEHFASLEDQLTFFETFEVIDEA